jgi:TolB-like protein/Tfp pilus assembly protein PilF
VSRVRFEAFELDLARCELRRAGNPVHIPPQPLKVLALLAGRAGQLVTREEIRQGIWNADTFVDFEQGLNFCIRQLRSALGDTAEAPRFIETVPRRGYRFVAPLRDEPAATERVMLAVLPFQDLSGEADGDYFSDGLTEEMIAQVGRLNPQRLRVTARTSAMHYKHTDKSIGAIGSELGVSHVLEGSVRRSAGRVRITAQLVLVADQTHVWAETFDRRMDDILELQSEIARAIATRIGVQLTPDARGPLTAARTVDPRVYEAYLKGRYFWKKRSRDALAKSVRLFTEAVELDPHYAPAYTGLADVRLTELDYNYLPPRDAFALADRVLLEALRLDNTLAEAHTSLGHLRLHQFEWEAAERHFLRAIALHAGYDTAHFYYANLLAAFGRFDEAVAEADRSLVLDPMSANTQQNRQFVLYLARRYDEAIEQSLETLEMDAGYTGIHYSLGLVYERQGQYDRAIEAFEKVAARPHNRGTTVLAAVGFTHARAGRCAPAARILEKLEAAARSDYVSSYDLALLHMALGNHDEAASRLARACDEHASFMPFVNVDARFDELRSNARFRAVVQRIGLG